MGLPVAGSLLEVFILLAIVIVAVLLVRILSLLRKISTADQGQRQVTNTHQDVRLSQGSRILEDLYAFEYAFTDLFSNHPHEKIQQLIANSLNGLVDQAHRLANEVDEKSYTLDPSKHTNAEAYFVLKGLISKMQQLVQ